MGPFGVTGDVEMKVVAFNGSPNKDGNTSRLIKYALDVIEKAGITTEFIRWGEDSLPCTACGNASRTRTRSVSRKMTW